MPKVTGCGEIEEIERGKVYRIRHHLGRDPKTGRYLRSPKRTVHGTKSDARRALEEYRRELEEGFANPENLTVPELGWRWHEQRKLLKDLSPLTHATDECELKKVERWFGGILVSDLSLSLLNMVYSSMREDHGVSQRGIHKLNAVLSQVMDLAVKERLVRHNPCRDVDVSRPRSAERTPLTLDGTRIDTYACSNELGSGDEIDGIGAICHEFSHCLGLADMYDTSYNGNFGLSKWGIMDQGNYNGDSFIPANYTSYERWYLGWIEPTELTGTMQVNNMKSLGESGESYIIYNEGNKDEYYMLENRTLTGWDSALPGSGLLVLHIDFDPTIWANNKVNSMPDKQYCTIFHADNSATTSASDLAGDTYPYAYNNSLTNTSKPAATLNNVNSDGSYNMNKAVTGITKNADGTISFAFEDQTSSPEDYNLPASYIFYESFDQCNGQGGNVGWFCGSWFG